MKLDKQILEAVNRGIKLALDNYEDSEIKNLKSGYIKDTSYTKEFMSLYNQCVDLGLPSKTLWAKYNLGCNYELLQQDPAAINKNTVQGYYYAWGEIRPKNTYTDGNYSLYWKPNNVSGYISKKYGKPDKLAKLSLEDDAAYVNTNGNFIMPTIKQINELIENTTYEFTDKCYGISGLDGVVLTSKINGNKLFFPLVGEKASRRKNEIYGENKLAGYWSCEMEDWKYDTGAITLHVNPTADNKAIMLNIYRWVGLSIRPILNFKLK